MDDITLIMEWRGYPEETHFSYSYTPIRSAGGKVEGFFCPCNEITAAVMAERAERESAVLNRQIFDSAIDYAIIAMDLKGKVTRWNEGARRVLGWDEAEMLGQAADRIFTPEDLAADRPAVERRCAIEEGRANDERWHVRKGGERFFAAGEMTPLRDAAGEAVGFIKVMRDRTEQRLVDEALRESQARLRELNETLEAQVAQRTAERDWVWNNSRDLLVVLGTDGILRAVNPAWESILGLTAAKLIGRHATEVVLPDDVPITEGALGEARAQRDLTSFENRCVHKDGSVRCISWHTKTEGDLIYAYGRDVTAEKQRQAELAAAHDQLRQAQKVEAVGQLTGGVAHDFNNLLTVILASVNLLRRPGVTEERRARYIEAIGDTADRATKLTNQLLAFARRQALTPELFDAGESVRGVADMIRTLAGARVQVAVETADAPCFVHADRNQFDTALINMAVNARDAMGGDGTLTIRVRAVDGMPAVRTHPAVAGDFVAVSLSDTGVGIPADRIERIFEPFFTTKGTGGGTGWG